MNIRDYVVLAVIVALVILAFVSIHRQKKSGRGCCGGCSGCCSTCQKNCTSRK